ncbi:MAG: UDP-N-acetylmuramate dehydrogenase [Bacteroidales bacterium]|jgi:UDP-N-acetylmuramate dehydrogenase|nr:UDP-N-acetylmuramate dehydrogenase [Bacteroidales bacterium]
MKLLKKHSLKNLNTFGIDVSAANFGIIETESQITEIFEEMEGQDLLVLGGGSNILLTADFPGLVLKMNIQGINILDQYGDNAWIQIGGGVEWEKVIDFAIENQLSGIENLTLIPGLAGTAPIQNIGAYGVELADVCESVEVFDTYKGMFFEIKKKDCHFGYRNSFFKQQARNRFIITSVILKLSTRFNPVLTYKALQDSILMEDELTLEKMRETVATLRKGKLPSISEVGSAGSFFKNPEISVKKFESLQALYPNMPAWPNADNFKIPAGWLIEQCGWKGYREGDAGVWPYQALVLVNYGNASGMDIWALAKKIQQSVDDAFGIRLESEVNII